MTPKELKRLKKLQKRSMDPPECETLVPRWDGLCIVAATGESLTKEVAESCQGHHVIAVKQAWKRFPDAEVLYSLDDYWWRHYWNKGVSEFKGEKWTAHDPSLSPKMHLVKEFRLRVVRGIMSPGFSTDPSVIHYGRNTGYQAINLAIHWLRGPKKRVVLVGFDFGGGYFFGQHPRGPEYSGHAPVFAPFFEQAAKLLPEGIEIINSSPICRLKCFPRIPLEEALAA